MGDSGDWDFGDLVLPLNSLQVGATLLIFDCLQVGAEGNVKRCSAEFEKACISKRAQGGCPNGRGLGELLPLQCLQKQGNPNKRAHGAGSILLRAKLLK